VQPIRRLVRGLPLLVLSGVVLVGTLGIRLPLALGGPARATPTPAPANTPAPFDDGSPPDHTLGGPSVVLGGPATNPGPVSNDTWIEPGKPGPTLVPTPVPEPVSRGPLFAPTPVPVPMQSSDIGAASRIIRVGLSTAGGPIALHAAGPVNLTDPTQPEHKWDVKDGDWITFTFGPVAEEREGHHRWSGPITVTCADKVSAGWGSVSVMVTQQPARISSNGTDPHWGRPYRGQFEISPQRAPDPNHRKGDLALINVVPLEEYLCGVVPWEMSAAAPIEALKAQAICARTKTLSLVASGHFSPGGFDVCDYDACQGYPGMENEKPATTEAVKATRGLALFYDGHPIDAVYSTNSGGVTAAAGDVWPHSEPYLQSVTDFPPDSPLARIWKPAMTEADWAAYCATPGLSYAMPGPEQRLDLASRRARSPRTAQLYGPEDWPEFYRWKRLVTAAEVNAAFAVRGFSAVTGFQVVERSPSGHIKQLLVTGFAGGPSATSALTAPQVPVWSANSEQLPHAVSGRSKRAGLLRFAENSPIDELPPPPLGGRVSPPTPEPAPTPEPGSGVLAPYVPGPVPGGTVPPPETGPLGAATPFSVTFDGDANIRAMFSRQLGSTTALPSSTFVVTPETDTAGHVSGWEFLGAGWGHGAGMCQRGAQNHAAEGWDAKRILNWYYRGISIRDINNEPQR